jgi:hypothetical protein
MSEEFDLKPAKPSEPDQTLALFLMMGYLSGVALAGEPVPAELVGPMAALKQGMALADARYGTKVVEPVGAAAEEHKRTPRRPPEGSNLLNEYQAAEEIGYAVSTLRTWRCRGKGPPWEKVEGAVRYDREELRRYRAKAHHDPASVRAAKETKRDHQAR